MKSKIKIKKSKLKTRKIKKAVKETVIAPKKVVNKFFSKAALKKYKQLLIAVRQKFVGEMERLTNDNLKKSQRDSSGDLSGYTFHMADMASDHYDREFSLGLASTEQKVIYDIDEALKKIEDGTYGVCSGCDKPIAKSRLKAVPHAKNCLSCQQKEELMHKKSA